MGKASRGKRERRSPRTLFHFTSTHHLPLIQRDGFIRTTESNLSFIEEHVGKDVVWLLDLSDAHDAPHGLVGSVFDKRAVRITVHVNAERWTDWAKRQPGYDAQQAAILVRTGGGPDAASHWWVTEQAIPRESWVEIARLGIDN